MKKDIIEQTKPKNISASENKRWREIYRRGREIAKKFNITSEEDIDRLVHSE